jgi:uroporphyrinogen-III decarboxylase
MFDQSDIARAKKILGKRFSIEGNVPSSLIVTGTPADVKEHCRRLIEACGKGGGYILSPGAMVGNPRLENLYAMVAAAKEFGTYKK